MFFQRLRLLPQRGLCLLYYTCCTQIELLSHALVRGVQLVNQTISRTFLFFVLTILPFAINVKVVLVRTLQTYKSNVLYVIVIKLFVYIRLD